METLFQVRPELADQTAAAGWFNDGLPDVAFGLALVLAGGAGFARVSLPDERLRMALALAGLLPLLVLFIWNQRILGAWKVRLRRRRGEIEPDQGPNRNTFGLRTGTVYMMLLVPQFITMFEDRSGLAIGMIVMAALAYASRSWSEPRFSWWSAALLGATGVPLSFLAVPSKAQSSLSILTGGFWLLCQGGWRLATYLRGNPPVATEGRPSISSPLTF